MNAGTCVCFHSRKIHPHVRQQDRGTNTKPHADRSRIKLIAKKNPHTESHPERDARSLARVKSLPSPPGIGPRAGRAVEIIQSNYKPGHFAPGNLRRPSAQSRTRPVPQQSQSDLAQRCTTESTAPGSHRGSRSTTLCMSAAPVFTTTMAQPRAIVTAK